MAPYTKGMKIPDNTEPPVYVTLTVHFEARNAADAAGKVQKIVTFTEELTGPTNYSVDYGGTE